MTLDKGADQNGWGDDAHFSETCGKPFRFRNEPLQSFEYKTAEQLVSDGRPEDLRRYIGWLQVGAAG